MWIKKNLLVISLRSLFGPEAMNYVACIYPLTTWLKICQPYMWAGSTLIFVNDLSFIRRRAITWTYDDLLSIALLETNFSDILYRFDVLKFRYISNSGHFVPTSMG